jgi:hypothetical protein
VPAATKGLQGLHRGFARYNVTAPDEELEELEKALLDTLVETRRLLRWRREHRLRA